MKTAIFSLLFFAAFAAQGQKPTTLKAEPSATVQKTPPMCRIYYYVPEKGVESIEAYTVRLVPDAQLGRDIYEILVLEGGKLEKKKIDSAIVNGVIYIGGDDKK
jgi:hypothetical protein